MSTTNRVRAWRDKLRQEGLVPMTIWVRPETKARYDDFGLTHRRSPSELARQALDAYRLDAASVAATVADTAQIRALIQAELAQMTADITAFVADTVTTTVTETLTAQLQDLAQTAMAARVTDTDTDTVPVTRGEDEVDLIQEARITDTDTDIVPVTHGKAGAPAPPEPALDAIQGTGSEMVSATVSVTETDTKTLPRRRQAGLPPPTAYDPDAAYARMQALQAQGHTLGADRRPAHRRRPPHASWEAVA